MRPQAAQVLARDPPLTTVALPHREMGMWCSETR